MHSHYLLQCPHASHCTCLHHLSTTSSTGHVATPARPETRGTGPDRDDSAVRPRLDRAAIERPPAVSRGDHAPLAAGVAAITVRPKGPPPDAARRHTVTAALWQLWQEPRAGSSPELASALGTRFQIQLSARSTRRYLQEMDATFRRTKASLQHKQDPVAVTQARSELDALKKKPGMGRFSSCTWMKAAMP